MSRRSFCILHILHSAWARVESAETFAPYTRHRSSLRNFYLLLIERNGPIVSVGPFCFQQNAKCKMQSGHRLILHFRYNPLVKIVLAGGSGFIGREVARVLSERGEIVVLSRNPSRVRVGRGVAWNPPAPGPWQEEVATADVVINLAGENISEGRWTDARKNELVSSRLDATKAIVDVLREHPRAGRLLLNASAVGFYGTALDEVLDESSPAGSDFLADLCRRWEAMAHEAEGAARVVILRFGIVLAADGGPLGKMMLPFKMFVGGPIGSGKQWMSWVDRDDVIRMIVWAIDHGTARGVYNVTAPNPVRNREFSAELGRAMSRPSIFPTPAVVLRLGLGEMADAILLCGQRVVPRRALADGFDFTYQELASSLHHQLPRGQGAEEPSS